MEANVDFRSTLQQAFSEPGPSLVVVPIDYPENPILTRKLGELITANA